MGTISLILHGTRDMPIYMNPGGSSSFEDFGPELIPEEEFEDSDPTALLAQFEQELQRMHHRKDDMSYFNFGF